MSRITIEFFHDVICSFCFPMSYRMRRLQEMRPDIEIVHRSFALVKEEDDFDQMFGSREAAKQEILRHWAHANQNDDLHRFNISGMQQADFPFPSSMKVLLACKAAYFTGGQEAYWDVFDALQNGLFVQSRNIEDLNVIYDILKGTDLDFEQWKQHFDNPGTMDAVSEDLFLAEKYGIHSVPCLIINGEYALSGALGLPQILQAVSGFTQESSGESCRLDDGKWNCE